MPGVSTFRREPTGGIARVAQATFGPGDPFCSVWHLFDLLDEGANDWSPSTPYYLRVVAQLPGGHRSVRAVALTDISYYDILLA